MINNRNTQRADAINAIVYQQRREAVAKEINSCNED
jgi:hypothetical protein